MDKDYGTRSADLNLGYIDLNTATEDDLARIPWIGLERARVLIHHRPFATMDDVRKVPGISEDIIDDLVRGGATVSNPAPPPTTDPGAGP